MNAITHSLAQRLLRIGDRRFGADGAVVIQPGDRERVISSRHLQLILRIGYSQYHIISFALDAVAAPARAHPLESDRRRHVEEDREVWTQLVVASTRAGRVAEPRSEDL